MAGAVDPVDQRVKPVEVELGRNLQLYLQRLGLLPKTSPAFGLSAAGKVEVVLTSLKPLILPLVLLLLPLIGLVRNLSGREQVKPSFLCTPPHTHFC